MTTRGISNGGDVDQHGAPAPDDPRSLEPQGQGGWGDHPGSNTGAGIPTQGHGEAMRESHIPAARPHPGQTVLCGMSLLEHPILPDRRGADGHQDPGEGRVHQSDNVGDAEDCQSSCLAAGLCRRPGAVDNVPVSIEGKRAIHRPFPDADRRQIDLRLPEDRRCEERPSPGIP